MQRVAILTGAQQKQVVKYWTPECDKVLGSKSGLKYCAQGGLFETTGVILWWEIQVVGAVRKARRQQSI